MTVQQVPVSAGAIIAELRLIADQVKQLHNRLERPAPWVRRTPFVPEHVRDRLEWWIVTVSGAGAITLQFGTSAVFTVQFAAADTKVIPLPVTLDRGKDITVVDASTVLVDSLLIGYPE